MLKENQFVFVSNHSSSKSSFILGFQEIQVYYLEVSTRNTFFLVVTK